MAQPDSTMGSHAGPADGAEQRERAHRLLLDWYAAAGRDLPWRRTRDPYAVLVSEVMLQQTQVDRVLPKYAEFLGRFPTLAALAQAPTADVIRAWAPLGYNVRAVRLQRIARQVVAEHGGSLPATLEGLLALAGIGRYTAGAIACFAFEQPVATVDTNIRRVLWRVFRGVEPAEWPTGQRAVREALALAEWALPPEAAYAWQQGLMDLGATVCLSRRPACERCPLTPICSAFAEVGALTLFPSGTALANLRAARAASGQQAASPSPPGASPPARQVAEAAAGYTVAGLDGAGPNKRTGRARDGRSAQPFTGSSRYFRGRVLAALRTLAPGQSLTLDTLGPQVKPDWTPGDTPWLRDIVTGLARDGLVSLDEGDLDDGDGAAEPVRARLP